MGWLSSGFRRLYLVAYRERLLEIAHHEAGHAVRAHMLGFSVENISLVQYGVMEMSRTALRRPNDASDEASIAISLAGPAATHYYFTDAPVFPKTSFYSGAPAIDLNLTLHSMRWSRNRGRGLRYTALRPEYCEAKGLLRNPSDIAEALDSVIGIYVNQHHRIPNKSTIITMYRQRERRVQHWIAENWSHIHSLAERVARCGGAEGFEHYMTSTMFKTWASRRGLSPPSTRGATR